MQTERERSLSDFWRQDRSDDRVMELVSVLRGADNLIGLMGSELRVTWSGQEVSYTDFVNQIVALDYGPIQGRGTPFPGTSVDEVIGYAAHEGGHCIWSMAGKDQSIEQEISRRWTELSPALKRGWSYNRQGTLAELCRIQNILEDAYIDFHVAARWEVLGEHIHISRQRLAERRPIDLEAIARQARPGRNSAMNLWIATSLYGYELPRRMSKRVRRAMTALLGLTSQAIGDSDGYRRHLLAVDAAIVLYKEFPTDEASMPILGQEGEGGEGEAGGEAQGTTAAGASGQEQEGEGSGGGSAQSETGEDPSQALGKRLTDLLRDVLEARASGESSDDGDESPDDGDESPSEPSPQGGDEAGSIGNLDDFDDRQVVEVPKRLLKEVANAILHEIEDLTESVAEVLAEPPSQVAASVRKADEDPELARKVTSQVMPQVQEIRRVFDRQQDVQARYLKGLDRGKLDSRRLARVGAGSLNVFQRRQVLDRPDMAMGLLLDVSGSMDDYMPIVEQTAAVFAEGLIRKPGVNFAAWTYTGGMAHVELTRICDRRLGKLCLANVSKGGGTPSGAAIAGVKVLMERMPERKKMLIHFTDGAPDSAHHVAEAVRKSRQAGIRVYAIGVGYMAGSLQSQYGPDNWETVSTVAELPHAVASLIKRLGSK